MYRVTALAVTGERRVLAECATQEEANKLRAGFIRGQCSMVAIETDDSPPIETDLRIAKKSNPTAKYPLARLWVMRRNLNVGPELVTINTQSDLDGLFCSFGRGWLAGR